VFPSSSPPLSPYLVHFSLLTFIKAKSVSKLEKNRLKWVVWAILEDFSAIQLQKGSKDTILYNFTPFLLCPENWYPLPFQQEFPENFYPFVSPKKIPLP
jgi:hypothetical protein